MKKLYRGRLAPSPTGLLHLGHARTFWIACQRALAVGGTLILRNEDLDPQRSRPEYAASMLEDLRWLGIRWQEGPDVGGPYAPYRQSQRYALYRAAWERLRAGGWIYPCRCSRRELALAAQAPHEDPFPHVRTERHAEPHGSEPSGEPLYPGTCRPSPGWVADAAEPGGINWRFRVPDGEILAFTDSHFGPQQAIAGRDFGDFLVWRRDDVPAYQLAVVVDDAAMAITEVVRGADLLRSTARQLLLYRALGFEPPAWRHCDLMLDTGGHRLAKRTNALSLRALRESGATPEQIRSTFSA
ncbi:MAG: tRNA glutamyl-Q(34) synthetase GluQRS [Acidobacteriaceae bacterium]